MKKIYYSILSVFLFVSVTTGYINNSPPVAASTTGFNAGKIIEDNVFVDYNSMSVSDIQSFLNSKVASCDTWGQKMYNSSLSRAQYAQSRGYSTPFTCLKDYSQNGISAAQIIYNASQQYQISPKTLIVLLQKEQGLVTDDWPWSLQYRGATGYGCPDTAPCDAQYYGLTNQLNWSARMFRSIMNDDPNWYTPYNLGSNFIRWNPEQSCGGSNVNVENRATQALYNYTPYQPNQAALNAGYRGGDGCSAYGNRNFYLYFRDWFGYNSGPVAFKTADSNTIYLNISGFKLTVPFGAVMQDYGISYEAVQTVSQQYADSIPLPPSGVSTSIGHVVKSPSDTDEDGGSIYLISTGKRYQIQSMEQFFGFGFKESQISYLPLSYILSKPNANELSNFITSPIGSVFKVEASTKRIFFEYGTYIKQNPSDKITRLSYYLADSIQSGNPITDKPVLIKQSSGESVVLYSDNTFSSIPNYDVYRCWGFETTFRTPVYRLPNNSYMAPVTSTTPLSCLNADSSTSYYLSEGIRIPIPSSTELTFIQVPSQLAPAFRGLPTRTHSLSPYIKANDSAAVWYTLSGKKRLIPTYNTFLAIGLSDVNIDKVSNQLLSMLTEDGIQLGPGQLVKDKSSAGVYIVDSSQRYGFATSDIFLAFKNTWTSIDPIENSSLERNYPASQNISPLLANKATNEVFMIASNGCYIFDSTVLSAYNKSFADIAGSQPYDSSLFKTISPSRNSCKSATRFIRASHQSLVYYMESGKKHPIRTYAEMLQKNGGTEPTVMAVDPLFVSSLPDPSQ